MTKLIIFDLDGTLLDTIEDLANSVNYALMQFNFPIHPIDDYKFFIGNGVNKLLERALPQNFRSSDHISMLKAEFIKHYFAHSDDFTKPYNGIYDLVNKLYSEGYQLGIASNKVHVATVDLVNRFFPHVEFTAVFGQRDGYPVKPNSGILEEIIELAGVSKKEVVYIGDSGVDVTTAINANVSFIGVLWGLRPRKELEDAGATIFVENADELYKHIITH